MAETKTKETPKTPNYQLLFRWLAGFAALATVLSGNNSSNVEQSLFIVLPIMLGYLLLAHLFVRFTRLTKLIQKRILARADALMLGFLVAWIHFDPLPSLLFFILLQFNAIIAGGMKRVFADNLFFIAGAIGLSFIKQSSFNLESNWQTSLAVLVALGIYFCVYALHSFSRTQALKNKVEELEKMQVQFKLRNYRLSKYLSPSLGKAIQSGKDVKLETQRKKLTIFFSDIKGFSELAEEMEADALTELLNSYLTEMSGIALRYGATIDKFIGDAIMVFFGDPTSKGTKADALDAVSMAVAMKQRMRELQLRWQNQGITKPLEIRMGINTGFCTVGNFGTENRLDYTLLGTEVNLANRLESAAVPGEILISHQTYSLVKDVVMCRDNGEITAKGFQEPIQVYSVVDMRKNLGKDQTYFEYMTEGFSVYIDLDKIRPYDRQRVATALRKAADMLRKTASF